jgi:2-dehydro-3-deoxyphosphogluconate aldolase/(4S)-4-hydroxy-2-oxoglutarate aldolase
MARFMRLEVINTMLDLGLVPLFYNSEVETAVEIVSAIARGGGRVVEFTNRGEMAYPVFTELVKHFAKADPSVILGVGSVMDAPTAALYLATGANFIVGPSHNPEISRLCNRRKIAYLPGCATETEIANAEEAGAEICKIFPGESAGGPGFISAVLAPCPWHRLLPTGGVDDRGQPWRVDQGRGGGGHGASSSWRRPSGAISIASPARWRSASVG